MAKTMPQVRYPIGPAAETPGYDGSRVHVGGVFIFLLCFAITMAVIFLATWGFERRLVGPVRPQDRAQPKEPLPLPQPLQPSPGHPALPWQDLAALRQRQQRELRLGAPAAADHGPHLPIDKAIDELLNSGVLNRPWKNPATQPYMRPADEKPALPSVENRT